VDMISVRFHQLVHRALLNISLRKKRTSSTICLAYLISQQIQSVRKLVVLIINCSPQSLRALNGNRIIDSKCYLYSVKFDEIINKLHVDA